MINLIFTRKSLLAGVKAESADLLSFEENSQIEFGNRNMREVLEDSIPEIIEKYSDYARKNKIVLNGSIPATLVFPVETTAREVHEIMHFVGSYSDVHFNIVHIDDLIQPFLHGQKLSSQDMKEPMIVLEGLDNYLSVVYYFNTKEVKHQSFITFEEKQAENHGQHVIDALVKEFEKIGFSLSEDDQKELRYQHTLNNSTYFIQKSNGVATLSASVRKEDLVLDKSASIDKYTLSRVLNKERLTKLGIKKVVLIGKHLLDYGYPQYLTEELGLGEMIYIPNSVESGKSFLTILNGIENRTSSPFQPDLKVAEVLKPQVQEKEFLDLSKLAPQLKEEELKEKFDLISRDKKEPKQEEKALLIPQEENQAQEEAAIAKEEVATEEQSSNIESEAREEQPEAKELPKEAKPQEGNPPVAQENNESLHVEEQSSEEGLAEEAEGGVSEPSIEILKKSLARLADKPLRDGRKEVEVASQPLEEEEFAEAEAEAEGKEESKKESKEEAPEQTEEEEESPVEAKAEVASPKPIVAATETPKAAEEVAAPIVAESKAEVKTESEAEVKPIAEPQVVAEVKGEKVQTLAKSPQTGIEEWNKISEMEETLKRQEEEERKKFEMLKEKLALQRKQKASQKAPEEVPNVPRKNARSINLKEAFEFIKNFPEEEFITQLVLDKNLRAKKVLRFVSNADFAQSYIEYKFLRLYDKESRYYPGISGLYESEEGKFYMRNYYKGSTLAEYANKAGLAKKHSLKKLSSSDLEFVVKVINEVNDSPVSHANLHANNIIIQEKGFWRFNTVEQIRLVGFTSDDCSQEDMLNRVHEIFHALLAPGVYSEFRNTLKL
ncbi:MAG: hypothetical protein R8P61_12830 [Bacteroidia bacterium]|nr:hypothetical protein [Bacteroidia bacterium]